MAIPGVIRRHGIITAVAIVVVLPLLIFVLCVTIMLHVSYSTGTRAGYLQKISEKGWICKTWEGELQQSAMPGAAPEKFIFSTRSDSIANMLMKLNGQHVMLTYEQHKHVPTACFGETEYYIVGAQVVGGS